MPSSDGYGQGVQYPVLSDAPNAETAFQTVVNGIVGRSVLRFANANERSAQLTGPYEAVPGMISYLIAEDRWDRYGADRVWRPMSPGPWKPFTFSTGYTAEAGSPGYRIVNGSVELRGVFRRSNNANLVIGTQTTFATLPTEARPTASRAFTTPASSGTGRVAALQVGGSLTYTVDSAVGFLYLDGIRFSLD
ncbi:hypothetical protein [Streptomyces sp. NTK 937]|uniref:hypothetical protein n=1 Tax=Streptomyces sp. NTK 937 TaxID=1487711 RepID=UPI0004A9473A|nr:hypothetical protein [Streptomyces sp. NTK 937]KDQ65752.1 hypothetical protein DT87_00415 [Streptomyces sp. NTK 937]